MIEPFPLDQGGHHLGEAHCMTVFPLYTMEGSHAGILVNPMKVTWLEVNEGGAGPAHIGRSTQEQAGQREPSLIWSH